MLHSNHGVTILAAYVLMIMMKMMIIVTMMIKDL